MSDVKNGLKDDRLLAGEPMSQAQDAEAPPNRVKAFWSNGAGGAFFGVVFALLMLQLAPPPWQPVAFVVGLTLLLGILSGMTGVMGTYLEPYLLSRGVRSEQARQGITVLLGTIINGAIVYSLGSATGLIRVSPFIERYAVMGGVIGLIFGIIYSIITHRNEVTRQRILLLEMQNRHLAELAQREELLHEASRNLAVAEERNRMTRELHDSISQGVHGIVYSLRSLRAVLEGNVRGMDILGHLEDTAAETLRELRHLVVELSPSALEERGLVEALRLHCDLFGRRQRMDVQFEGDYQGQLEPDQEMALYRILQEALTNVQRHAQATGVGVSLKAEDEGVILLVEDNGKGFDPVQVTPGHGLGNMVSRARQSGGRLEMDSVPGEGTRVRVTFIP